MKYKKIFLITAVLLSFFTGLPRANVALASSKELCRDINEGIKIPILKCEEGDVVSFQGFEGGLQAPSGAGLSETLTRAKTARDFIRDTLNFALSFLGIIALAIVIYGGFLYVTAAGNEEQSGKGKKSLTYAAIGIVIIIGSFALVRTLLTSVGGPGSEGSGVNIRGVGQEGTNIDQQSIYNSLADVIQKSLNDFIKAYKDLVTVESFLKQAENVSRPVERDENKQYLSEVTSLVREIQNNTNSLSKTHGAAKKFLEGWLGQTAAKNLLSEEFKNGSLKDQFLDKLTGEAKIKTSSNEDFSQALDEIRRPSSNKGGRLATVEKILGKITEASAGEAINKGFLTEKDLARAFSDIDPSTPVKQILDDAFTNLEAARNLTSDSTNTKLVIDVVKALDRLFVVVKNLRFVFVKIRATNQEGNAPFTVELNGLDSRDPSGITITDSRYEWDPEGVDTRSGQRPNVPQGAVECSSRVGPSIFCTYHQPGTYVVSLRIASSDPGRIATGQAFLPITVLPTVARISLKATAGSISEELHKYETDSSGKFKLSINKNEFQVTSGEAKNPGVTFDASASRAGSGAEIKEFEWSFGDETPLEKGPLAKIVKHSYQKKGKFPFKLEVTDTGNRKDRKLLNVIISSLAARTLVNKTEAEPDNTLEFDGSISRSDKGAISSYAWKVIEIKQDRSEEEITNLTNRLTIIGKPNTASLRVKFKNPGTYKVILEVNDGTSSATHTDVINIKSRKPKANFSILACPKACPSTLRPGIIELDASASFDPDGSKLLYEWMVFDDRGAELQKDASFEILDGKSLQGKESKKIKISLRKTGKYRIRLSVKNDLAPNLQQTDTRDQEITINSIVEMKWDEGLKTVEKLDQSQAKILFKGKILNANRVQIDFGDQTTPVTQEISNSAFSVEHTYEQAGTFLVSVKASSDEGHGENTMTKRVYITSADAPQAVLDMFVDGVEIVPQEPTAQNPKPGFEVLRGKIVKFDASKSVNSSGMSEKLRYSWNFGDSSSPRTGKMQEHAYTDPSPVNSPYEVILTVVEEDNPLKRSEIKHSINVISKKPQVTSLSLQRKTAGGQRTPVDIEVKAENVTVTDGKATNFQFWYFDELDKETKLGVVDTPLDHATLTVETKGEENEEREYSFCVSVTDNHNATSECSELFQEDELPKIKVKNGPNKPPVTSFSVDRTAGKVGDSFTFTSNSSDPDGRIVKYVWDLEGDGFGNNNPTQEATITHSYIRKSPSSGYRVKLKAIDDKGATGISREIPIFVTTKSNPPTAKFKAQARTDLPKSVTFRDESTADSANGASVIKWKWDIDTLTEPQACRNEPKPAYCNGDPKDDWEYTEQEFTHPYEISKEYRVRLFVEDSDGNTAETTQTVSTTRGIPTGLGRSVTIAGLEAQLVTSPRYRIETIRGEKKKVLRIPADREKRAIGQPISFLWNESKGDIISYTIDKNIWCDSEGSGLGAENRDHIFPDSSDPENRKFVPSPACREPKNCWTTTYLPYMKTRHPAGPGRFTAQLTVKDRTGKSVTDSVEIIFEGNIDPAKVEEFKALSCDGT